MTEAFVDMNKGSHLSRRAATQKKKLRVSAPPLCHRLVHQGHWRLLKVHYSLWRPALHWRSFDLMQPFLFTLCLSKHRTKAFSTLASSLTEEVNGQDIFRRQNVSVSISALQFPAFLLFILAAAPPCSPYFQNSFHTCTCRWKKEFLHGCTDLLHTSYSANF